VLGEFRNDAAERGVTKEVVARLFVCPSEDVEAVSKIGRRAIAGYLTVPAYAQYQRWLGRGELLAGMWQAWSGGDRAGALRAIPDQVLDELVIHGSLEQCRAHIARFIEAGVTTVVLQLLLPADIKLADAIAGLAPRR
jgi:alkanesulfonate monooxygenase SsuD/methylene tetrahydromethanopterin reductase-like flavin-dependent oxidoreductase (luciferase family)